jgi:hypothetical protein
VSIRSIDGAPNRVARWFLFKPKIPIWVDFGGPWIEKCWYILQEFGIFYDHSVHFEFIWYIFSGFGIMYQEKSGIPGTNAESLIYTIGVYVDPLFPVIHRLH